MPLSVWPALPSSGLIESDALPKPTATPRVRLIGRMASAPARGSAIGLMAGPPIPKVVAAREVSEVVGCAEP